MSLDKHGNRCNSPFPRASGDTASKNAQGINQLNEILSNPNSRIVESSRGEIRIHSPDGRGAHFRSDGSFKGFLDYE
jgi:hypothetical protein